MHYTYLAAIGKPKAIAQRWVSLDLDTMTLSDALKDYREIVVLLSHPTLSKPEILPLSKIQSRFFGYQGSFIDWLNENENTTLPTEQGDLNTEPRLVKWYDLWQNNFKISVTKMTSHPDTPYQANEVRDLLITKPDINYHELNDYSLFTVNGLLHRSSASDHGIYIIDGAYQKEKNMAGVMSFGNVGKIEILPLSSDMIYRPTAEGKTYEQCYINLGQSTKNKQVLLSLGGYLHTYDKIYQMIGDGLMMINFNHYPMIQRYYDSVNEIDLSSLPLSKFPSNDDQVVVMEMIASEDTIDAFLNLSQSFIILIDSPDLFIDHYSVERTPLPGTYLSHTTPRLPLKLSRGRIREYWHREDYGQYVLQVDDNRVPQYTFERTGYEELYSVNSQKYSYQPYILDRASFLEIGRQR